MNRPIAVGRLLRAAAVVAATCAALCAGMTCTVPGSQDKELSGTRLGSKYESSKDLSDFYDEMVARCCATRGCKGVWCTQDKASALDTKCYMMSAGTGYDSCSDDWLYDCKAAWITKTVDTGASTADLGCWEHSEQDFPESSALASNTVSACAATCLAREWPYAGACGGDCRCGTSYDSLGAAVSCSTPCPGDTGAVCGNASSTPTANSVRGTGIVPWTCADDFFPSFTITTPASGTVYSTASTVSVSVGWSWTIPVFDRVCWVAGFDVEAVMWDGTTVTGSTTVGFSDSTSARSASKTLSGIGYNSHVNPNTTLTVYMLNSYDNSRKASEPITICVAELPSVVLSSPSAGSVLTQKNETVVLSWDEADWGFTCGAESRSYDVYLSTTAPPSFYINVPEDQTSLTLTSPANGTWYWSVKPRNNAYTSSSMTTQSFVACFGVRFALSTAAPATVYSTNGVSAAINFTWTTSGWSPSCASSIQESMLKYKIFVGKNTTPDTLLAEDIDSTFFEATLGVGTWNWVFVPVLNGEDLDASEVFQLTVTYCSDGIAQFPEEECDGGDGCLSDCTCGPLWLPVGSASLSCVPKCGDNVTVGDEECDSGLGCTSMCTCNTSAGWYPKSVHQKDCETHCGDNITAGAEDCDSGTNCRDDCSCKPCTTFTEPRTNNCIFMDGGYCTLESGHLKDYYWCEGGTGGYLECPDGDVCLNEGFQTTPCLPTTCGDGVVAGTEQCDSGLNCKPVYCLCKTGFGPTNPPSNDCVALPVASSGSTEPVSNSNGGGGGAGLSTGAVIALAVCGTVLGIALISGAIFLVLHLRRKNTPPELVQSGGAVMLDPNAVVFMTDSNGIGMIPMVGVDPNMDPNMMMFPAAGLGSGGMDSTMAITPAHPSAGENSGASQMQPTHTPHCNQK